MAETSALQETLPVPCEGFIDVCFSWYVPALEYIQLRILGRSMPDTDARQSIVVFVVEGLVSPILNLHILVARPGFRAEEACAPRTKNDSAVGVNDTSIQFRDILA